MTFANAGDYNRPVQRLVRTTSKDSYGATAYILAADGNTYFANIQQTQSQEVDELGRVVTVTRAEVRLKGVYLTITVLDRLVDLNWNETYIIDSIARNDATDEYVLQVHHL